jgi:hypothetical protein
LWSFCQVFCVFPHAWLVPFLILPIVVRFDSLYFFLDLFFFIFFLKRRQKICLYLLIKKKRIAQLINGKPGENRYNTTNKRKTPKTCNLQTNKLSTYNLELTTPGAPRWST